MTKDDGFRVSHLLSRRPARLLHVTCGNIATAHLLALVDQFHTDLMAALESYNYVELDSPGVIVHDPA